MTPYYTDDTVTLYHGDALAVLRQLPDGSVDCCVTSPPYFGLRDYGAAGQYGLERSPADYVETMRAVFAEVRRVLADDGTLWLNLGDSYAGTGETGRNDTAEASSDGGSTRYPSLVQSARAKRRLLVDYGVSAKNLLAIPWRVALALQDDGWVLRSDVIWHKPNAMPESVTDRPSCTHEHVFLLAKQPRYWFDLDAIRQPLARPEALGEGIVFGGNANGEAGIAATYRRRGGNLSVYGQARAKTDEPGDTPPGMKPQTNRAATGERHKLVHERGRNPGNVWTLPTQPFTGWVSARTARSDSDHHDPGEPAYGTRRIASPDCPVHASRDRPASTTGGGGHAIASPIRSDSNGAGPVRGRADDSAPTDRRHERSTLERSSGSPRLASESSATSRSSRSHRMDHAPVTTQPYTPSARSRSRTGRNEGPPGSVELPLSMPLSRSGEHDSRAGPGQRADGNVRMCRCSWEKPSGISHFAVMPPALAERCVKSGCRPGGVVLDPFCGSGTTGMVANRLGRRFVGVDLSSDYLDLALRTRLRQAALADGDEGRVG